MMLTSFDDLRYEMQLELDYLESQLKEYESDRESFSEWLIYETQGKILILRKMLSRADALANQEALTALVDEVLANPPLTTAVQVEEATASESGLESYNPDYAPQILVEAPSVGLVAKVERFEQYPAGWVAWLSVRIPGKTHSARGDCFWLPVGELFGEFRPLAERPRVRTERAPSALYSLGFTRNRKELKQLFGGISPPANPSLYHTIIEMPDGSKWQTVPSGCKRGVKWQCVFANGDGYSDLFPVAV